MTTLTPAQTEIVRQCALRLESLPGRGGARKKEVASAAAALACSVSTLYRLLADVAGWSSGRKARKDKGTTTVSMEQARAVAKLAHFDRRSTGKDMLPLKTAAAIIASQPGADKLPSVSTVSRAMRLYDCHPADLKAGKAKGRVRSLYPNHVWQIDASVCVLYYLRGSKSVGLLDERVYNARKPGRLAEVENARVVRYVVADHASGAFYLRYVLAKGEDARGVLNTLIDAMTDRGPRDPMHGVPEILYTDQGSGNRSSLVTDLCKRLGIKTLCHMPGAASATGAVEVLQNLVERQFEGRCRFLDVPDIAALQQKADQWRTHFCATAIHTRHRMTRSGAWIKIPAERLRTVERDVLMALAAWKDETRTVAQDFTITIDTRTGYGVQRYDLRTLGYHGVKPRDRVVVTLNPYKAPAVVVSKKQANGETLRFEVAPVQTDPFGQDTSAPVFGESFRQTPDTATDTVLKSLRREAFGVTTDREADAAERAKKRPCKDVDIMADVKDSMLFMRKPGTPADIAARDEVAAAPVSRVQFAVWMRGAYKDVWTDATATACMEYLAARFPDGVIPGDKKEAVAEALVQRFAPKKACVLPFGRQTGEEKQEAVSCAG